ncbi:MAG: hypothetical protein FWD82_01595 [Defluviitaleaceae bacterium]|nr:hypothetical protein [Defluviitaleaceae bacterium]
MNNNINWSQFEACNQDQTTSFENMCRLLFNRMFFDNNAILHSNPNNPGIEVLPVLHTKTNKQISFQSKYVTSIGEAYKQFAESTRKAVKYYTNQLDTIYFYCNKELTTTSKQYKAIETTLQSANITLVLVNNQAILDRVIEYPIIASLYFNQHNLTPNWFKSHIEVSLDSLGPRYNSELNVDTNIGEYVELFSQTDDSIHRINQKKFVAMKEIKKNIWRYSGYNRDLIDKIYDKILSIVDISLSTISQCLSWSTTLQEEFSIEFTKLSMEISKKESCFVNGKSDENISEMNKIRSEVRNLEWLLNTPRLVSFDDTERKLITGKVLVISGEAGSGKSQLFATAAEKNISLGNRALLLLGHTFLSSNPINTSIVEQLNLTYSISELLYVLEGLGEADGCCTVIYIDALNESATRDIWKTGLIQFINEVNKLKFVRLAVSVRSGYEKLVFDDTTLSRIKNSEIAEIIHYGFRENLADAMTSFLNYYNISFSPAYFLQYEMTNPLFLTLFCKTYNGENYDMLTLFEKIIEKTGEDIEKTINVDGLSGSFKNFVAEVVQFMVDNDSHYISKMDILNLGYWKTHGLDNHKTPFIAALEKSGLLLSFFRSESYIYSFGYNLLEDFLLAKHMFKKFSDKESLKIYLQNEVSKINKGDFRVDINVFIIICGLYAEKYGEECIDVINDVVDENYKYDLAKHYVESFIWRKSNNINSEYFIDFVNDHQVDCDIVWNVLIANSTKESHPLNAELLHNILLHKPLNERDYMWTIYINKLYEEERLFQLVELFDKGKYLSKMSQTVIELLLKLFGWLLTSSNRPLRDKASKAMIELLKLNFHMCKGLLQAFESVNDPYVIQRLYGVVFGACMKRVRKENDDVNFKELSVYVYDVIFNQDNVYPDVLLRDYARLIIERWIYEFPCVANEIDCNKVRPPYRSEAIPIVEEEEYYLKDVRNSGFNRIVYSMKTEKQGMYGDFGRYVFQSALNYFKDVNIENLYHYAMQFIRDELGYSDDLFGVRDTSDRYYDRHDTKKAERIGKKYQWIAMYNILARISDTHHLDGRWRDFGEDVDTFEGAWEPDVRDFDPTLNNSFLLPPNLPKFNTNETLEDEFVCLTEKNRESIIEWAKSEGNFLDKHPKKLQLVDETGQEWIMLYQYENIKNTSKDDYDTPGRQDIWSMSFGTVVKQESFEDIMSDLKTRNFMGRWFPEGYSIYQLFNREYYWSPSCNNVFRDSWREYEIETGEKIVEKHNSMIPKFKSTMEDLDELPVRELENLLENYDTDDSKLGVSLYFEEKEWETTVNVKKLLAKVMPTYSNFTWEEGYDSSQEESTSFYMPCKDIIDYLELEQREYDGYFYNKDDILVAFDGTLSKNSNGLLIRKDYIEKYLADNNLRLFWACLGEKNFHSGGISSRDFVRGEWSGLFHLENGSVIGKMEHKELYSYPYKLRN